MLFTSLRQLPELLFMLYCGIIIGVLYDLFSILRRRKKTWLVHLADILFCLCALLCCGYFLFYGTEGAVHFYHFVGIAVGFGLEALGFKPILKFILDILERALYNLTKWFKTLPLFKKLTK